MLTRIFPYQLDEAQFTAGCPDMTLALMSAKNSPSDNFMTGLGNRGRGVNLIVEGREVTVDRSVAKSPRFFKDYLARHLGQQNTEIVFDKVNQVHCGLYTYAIKSALGMDYTWVQKYEGASNPVHFTYTLFKDAEGLLCFRVRIGSNKKKDACTLMHGANMLAEISGETEYVLGFTKDGFRMLSFGTDAKCYYDAVRGENPLTLKSLLTDPKVVILDQAACQAITRSEPAEVTRLDESANSNNHAPSRSSSIVSTAESESEAQNLVALPQALRLKKSASLAMLQKIFGWPTGQGRSTKDYIVYALTLGFIVQPITWLLMNTINNPLKQLADLSLRASEVTSSKPAAFLLYAAHLVVGALSFISRSIFEPVQNIKDAWETNPSTAIVSALFTVACYAIIAFVCAPLLLPMLPAVLAKVAALATLAFVAISNKVNEIMDDKARARVVPQEIEVVVPEARNHQGNRASTNRMQASLSVAPRSTVANNAEATIEPAVQPKSIFVGKKLLRSNSMTEDQIAKPSVLQRKRSM